MKNKTVLMLMCILGSVAISYIHMQGHLWSALYAQSAPTFQLPKGSKVVLGKYNNKEIVWDIGNNTNDYVLMSSIPIVRDIQKYDSSIGCTKYNHPVMTGRYYYDCPNTVLDMKINNINLTVYELSLLSRNFFVPN